MKKLLLITSTPLSHKSGGGYANKAIFDALALRFPGKVDVVQLKHSNSDINAEGFFYIPGLNKIEQLSLFAQGHINRVYSWLPFFLEHNHLNYSHCIVNCGIYGDLIPILRKYGIRVAVIHHNFEVAFQKDNKLPSTLWGLSSFLVRKCEQKAYLESDINLFLTDYDRKTFERYYGDTGKENNYTIGIFEPNHYATPEFDLREVTVNNKIAVCGSLDNVQTVKAVKYVFNNLYEIINDLYSGDFEIVIAGRNPGSYIIKESQIKNNVKLFPSPTSIEPIISSCSILLCPVYCGSGVKLRIMDGLKLGIPILTHEVSARGYEFFQNEPWFRIYSSKDDFGVALLSLMKYIQSNPNIRGTIISKYKDFFSFENGSKRLLSIIDPFVLK